MIVEEEVLQFFDSLFSGSLRVNFNKSITSGLLGIVSSEDLDWLDFATNFTVLKYLLKLLFGSLEVKIFNKYLSLLLGLGVILIRRIRVRRARALFLFRFLLDLFLFGLFLCGEELDRGKL
jgi:hypothetical protein